ncbi:hypothetical protein [Pseudomonas chlororaphis]|uniref:hypothetical protein n=1 Tax=Pseudomonas chlororaphis TaxID=587753 RepID=UPI0039E2D58D
MKREQIQAQWPAQKNLESVMVCSQSVSRAYRPKMPISLTALASPTGKAAKNPETPKIKTGKLSHHPPSDRASAAVPPPSKNLLLSNIKTPSRLKIFKG